MIKVGITGGIGSGKSTVCQLFRVLGIPVFNADYEAKRLINYSDSIRSQLIALFGSDIYLPVGAIDREKLASRIFNSPPLLEKVNSIVHPEVRNYFEQWAQRQNAPYVLHEAAIMFESGLYDMMDYTILVTAPEEDRIQRVMARDLTDETSVLARIDKQWPDSKKAELASFIVYNDNKHPMLAQLVELDKRFRTHG